MILAFDTYYYQENATEKAKTVCVAYESWTADKPSKILHETITSIAAYEPGAFYKRELPCITSLLKKIPFEGIECIVVDGFVYLNDEGKKGLGGHLYENLGQKTPIIGVAKSNFRTLEKNKRALLRGDSKKPLYITSAGIDIDEALKLIESMHGPFRMPTLLQILDTESKNLDKNLTEIKNSFQ